jgi:hypothetical protein
MAQISRPFQIVLAVFVLFAVAWFAVLHRPGSESTTGAPAPSSASSGGAAAHASPATHAGSATHGTATHGAATHATGHGSASAIRRTSASAIHHARVAPATHSHSAKVAARAHAKPATPTTTEHHKATAHTGAAQSGHSGAHAAHQSQTALATAATAAFTLHNLTAALHLSAVVKLVELLDPALNLKTKVTHAEGVLIARMKAALQPASQATVASDLHHGKTVLLLFVNPHSYDDDATAIDAVEVAHKLGHKVAVHLALAKQVNSFGSITRDIQLYQTPTLLIVNAKRQVETITGLVDAYAIEQAVAEARGEAVKLPS